MLNFNRPPSGEAEHEFGALNTFLLVAVLGLCIFCAYLIKQYKFYYLPESAAAMMVGLLVGACARVFYPSHKELAFLSFNSSIFFFLLLPPIVFEAGYTLSKKRFFDNFSTILLYAVVGTVISTFFVGFATFGFGKLGLLQIDSSSPLEALLFGALISAVDPVATLSIMGSSELHCHPLLYSLVFGESVLNDAVAIVLYNTFRNYHVAHAEFGLGTVFQMLSNFVAVSLGSVGVGIAVGLLCSFMCRNTEMSKYPKFEISSLLLYAYGSYALAEAVKLSGIMALFFCGIVMKHYNSYNLSKKSQVTTEYIFKSFALVSEFFVFLYMGMGFFAGQFQNWSLFFFLSALLFCLVGRLFNTFPLSWVANLRRSQKIPRAMQIVIWFAGLRGAIAFALAQTMPGPNKDLYATTTLSVCVFTTIVCGGLTEPLLSWAGMKVPPETTSAETEDVNLLHEVQGTPSPRPRGRRVQRRDSAIQSYWQMIDARYMKPIFGGDAGSGSAPAAIATVLSPRGASAGLSGSLNYRVEGITPAVKSRGGDRGEELGVRKPVADEVQRNKHDYEETSIKNGSITRGQAEMTSADSHSAHHNVT